MRSRYAAFALGLGDYLTETLASDHPDRAMSAAELSKGLFASWRRQRFLGLTIASAKTDGDQGQVLFLARVFEKGQDRSFAELSQFRKEAGGWRYASGVLVRKEDLPSDVASLTPEALLALAR